MSDGIATKNNLEIPEHELEISTSRSGGAGGQHVNKTDTKITIRWNVKNTNALTEDQKARALQNLHNRLTAEGDLIINNSESRSQQHNKKMALYQLIKTVEKALYVPKKRMKTRTPKGVVEARLNNKSARSEIKKMRKKIDWD